MPVDWGTAGRLAYGSLEYTYRTAMYVCHVTAKRRKAARAKPTPDKKSPLWYC